MNTCFVCHEEEVINEALLGHIRLFYKDSNIFKCVCACDCVFTSYNSSMKHVCAKNMDAAEKTNSVLPKSSLRSDEIPPSNVRESCSALNCVTSSANIVIDVWFEDDDVDPAHINDDDDICDDIDEFAKSL